MKFLPNFAKNLLRRLVFFPFMRLLFAARARARWTHVFCDHNVLIMFHIMRVWGQYSPQDIEPGATLSQFQWQSHTTQCRRPHTVFVTYYHLPSQELLPFFVDFSASSRTRFVRFGGYHSARWHINRWVELISRWRIFLMPVVLSNNTWNFWA
jgi:hypothetical protein